MHEFIAKHQPQILGVLSGCDRLVFRGTLRSIAHVDGMKRYLWANQVLLKDFGAHVEQVSHRLKDASVAAARHAGRPVQYLASSDTDKDSVARQIAANDRITEGLLCVLTCVEPCWSFAIYRNRDTKKLALEPRQLKCLFLYQYSIHPRWGSMYARIQSWCPFSVQIGLNGREWLARQMDAAHVPSVRQDNCFPWIADWSEAQRLMDRQVRTTWPTPLHRLAAALNPAHTAIFHAYPLSYSWVYRPKEGDPDGPRPWRVMRRGIADLHRRAEVSRKAAERYLDALASVDDDTTLGELIQRVAQPTHWHRRRVRALRPFSDDRRLLEGVSRGEFTLNGVRNRDLQRVFFPEPAQTPADARRRSAWVSRRLRLRRAHGLLRKIAGTHRYHVTKAGRTITTAILTALRSTVRQLTPAA